MSVHAARLSDVRMVRALGRDAEAVIIPPVAGLVGHIPASGRRIEWTPSGWRTQTLVIRQRKKVHGFVQLRARMGQDAWDIRHLCCKAIDQDLWTGACQDLLDYASLTAAQHGALRTFVRLPSESTHVSLLAASHYRPFTTEITLRGTLDTVIGAASLPDLPVRPKLPRDAWDIFSLYNAVTPALVRHAEVRNLKEWRDSSYPGLRAVRRWQPVHEVVWGEPGMLQGWLCWRSRRKHGIQLMELLVRPDAVPDLPQLLRAAVDVYGLDPNCTTICRTREYDGRISATLELAGFEPCARETLMVRHTVARVAERQLLVAALRAHGLGIDLSQYHRGVEVAHQRLVSSGGVNIHSYDRNDGASYYG
jgi:hypothetical protein